MILINHIDIYSYLKSLENFLLQFIYKIVTFFIQSLSSIRIFLKNTYLNVTKITGLSKSLVMFNLLIIDIHQDFRSLFGTKTTGS